MIRSLRKRRRYSWCATFLLACASTTALAQEDFPHPELEWRTLESAHFLVHYHDGSGERTARVIAKIAEDIFEPITSLYNHIPDQKVSFIVKDYDDIANGGAYFFENKIEIFAPSMDFDFRGTHNWLRDVVSHEFTHIIQAQTAMKFGRRMPAFYLQWLNYEAERRPDVLYGYPNVIASYPLTGWVVPVWFAEGVAQYNRKELRYDFWDTHRDMILRSYALEGKMLTWEQMGVFGKTALGNESSYNAGFAFVRYLARTYGENRLSEISRNLATFTEVSIDGAIERAVGRSGGQVYRDWQEECARDYAARSAPVKANLRQGEPLTAEGEADVVDPGQLIVPESMFRSPREGAGLRLSGEVLCPLRAVTGFANLYPAYSPDGRKLAYTSAKGGDYFSLSSLWVVDLDSKKEKLVQPGVRTRVTWSPDGKKLYYGRATRDNPHWSYQSDVYCYDLEKEAETRLTFGRRATSPAVSPDGATVAFVTQSDGTSNLAVCGVDGSGYRLLTGYQNGEQVYVPVWSPAGDRIAFDYSVRDGRDIAWVRPDGSDLTFLLDSPDDERSPAFTADGRKIIFSSDRSGIFNIYSRATEGGPVDQLTNVLGGAFYPTVNARGDLVYAAYTSGGYKLHRLDNAGAMPAGEYAYRRPALDDVLAGSMPPPPEGVRQFDWKTLRSYDDRILPASAPRAYRSVFSSLMIVPFLRIDNYNSRSKGIDVVKPGVFLFSDDVLDKTGFFASLALNTKLERDIYVQFHYRGKVPLLYQLGLEPVTSFELFNVTRKTDNVISLPASTIPVDVGYNLLEADLAFSHPFLSQFSALEFRYAHSRYTSVIESFINPETTPPSLVSASSDLYLIANTLSLSLSLNHLVPSRTGEINPVGRSIRLRLAREFNKFNGDGEYEVTSTGLAPKYKTINFTRLEGRWREHLPIFRSQTLTATLRGGTIFGPPVDEFFDFYAGGLVGMKGYPFYAIGGNRMVTGSVEYRFPLVKDIDWRFLQFTFDKLYASVYAEAGDAWTGLSPRLRDLKTDAGLELRLETFSFYAYPTRIFFNAAYGFSRFDRFVRNRETTVSYGKEWRFYLGVLFNFDLD